MKKLCMIIPLALILCFTFGCQDKEATAELEEMKAQAEIEEQNKELVRHWVEEEDKGNFDTYHKLLSDNYICHYPGSPEPLTRDVHKQSAQLFYEAFPDAKHTIENIIADRDMVVFRTIIKGSHKGEFMGISPTGNEIAIGAIFICRIIEGKIVEVWGEADLLSLMQQLGMELKPKQGSSGK